jgi:UV DNA damage endonuclease
MRIGYACIPVTVPYKTTRTFILKNFSFDRFHEAAKSNLDDLFNILRSNLAKNIYFFRISSDIIPFGSHEINNIEWWKLFREELTAIGNFIKTNSIRVSMHPGQYTVLNSTSKDTVWRSIQELEYHALFLDSLGLDYTHKLVLHVGGVYGDKTSSLDRFCENFLRLSDSAKNRLIVENDEKSYSIEDVLGLCKRIGAPAVFDNLHHRYNPSMAEDLAPILAAVKDTWKKKDGNMKVHYSDSSLQKRFGAHSDFVVTENFLKYYELAKPFNPDIMLEVKDKDISAVKCINCTSGNTKKSLIYEEWSKYKYLVMEKNYSLYKECSALVNSGASIIDFYRFVDDCLMLPYSGENFNNTALHLWGYFKNKATDGEKRQFFSLLDSFDDYQKVKNRLNRLALKYKEDYLLRSYYFVH